MTSITSSKNIIFIIIQLCTSFDLGVALVIACIVGKEEAMDLACNSRFSCGLGLNTSGLFYIED